MNGSAHIRVGTIDSHRPDLLCRGLLAHCLRHSSFFIEPAHLIGAISTSSDRQFAFGSCVAQLAML
jgi:hypothetical protein